MKSVFCLCLISGIAFAFAGCATPEQEALQRRKDWAERVKVGFVNEANRPPKIGDIDIIRNGVPQRPYKEIAVLTLRDDAEDEAEAIGGMIYRARALGADGLILLDYDAPNGGLAIANPITQNKGARVFRSTAFIYLDQK